MMAPATIPTVSDGTVLSASHLNLVNEWIQYLDGKASSTNNPFIQFEDDVADTAQHTVTYEFTNRGRYLHYSVTFSDQDHDEFIITYNGSTVASDLGSQTAPHTFSGSFDLDTLALTELERYDCVITYRFQASGGNLKIDYLLQSEEATV